jgi:exonuclease SbcC
MAPQEKQRRHQALTQFRTDLANAQQALEEQRVLLDGKTAPDMIVIEKVLTQAQSNAMTAARNLALAEKRQQIVARDNLTLTEKSKTLAQRRIGVEADMAFAERLRGRSGCSLQRYVLGVMLNAITREANRLLENVYGGRYRLYRSDERSAGTNKRGLELEVSDSDNMSRRSVTTLSGGEKFLVALSLAIGLSTVVQAQGHGIRLEAMFVDEGFGSLDRDSICDALEVLQGIQRGAGVVGIISHVEQLAETIPTKIVITKTKNGSRCTVVQ